MALGAEYRRLHESYAIIDALARALDGYLAQTSTRTRTERRLLWSALLGAGDERAEGRAVVADHVEDVAGDHR